MFGVVLLSCACFLRIVSSARCCALVRYGLTLWRWIKYIVVLGAVLACYVPVFEGYGIFELWYAFFESPSYFSAILLACFVLKQVLNDIFYKKQPAFILYINKHIRLTTTCLIIICLYTSLTLFGTLALIPIDPYHMAFVPQGLFCLCVVMGLYLAVPYVGVAALISIVLGFMHLAMLDSISDVFLWLFCVCALVRRCVVWVLSMV